MVGKGIHGHVFADAEDAALQVQQLRELRGVLATETIDHMPAIRHVTVQAHIVGSILRRILAPPLLVDQVPGDSIQHVSQLVDVVIDRRVDA
eukprot:Skav204443  [mRNA]  locus=scaffold1093:310623:322616:- [translate_table: standard]